MNEYNIKKLTQQMREYGKVNDQIYRDQLIVVGYEAGMSATMIQSLMNVSGSVYYGALKRNNVDYLHKYTPSSH